MLRMFKCNFLLRELCPRSSNQLLRFNSSPFLSCPTSVKTFWVSAVNFLDSFLPFSIPLPSSDVCQSMPSLLLTSFQSILSALLAVWLSFYSSLCCENPLTHSTTLPGSAPIQPSSRLNPTPAVFGSQAPWVASRLHAVISAWNPTVTLPKKEFSLSLKAQLPHGFPPPPSPPHSHPLPLLVRSTIHPQYSILWRWQWRVPTNWQTR